MKDFLKKNKRRKWIRGYKILKECDGKLYSVFYGNKPWRVGEMISSSRKEIVSTEQNKEINRGIHVYLSAEGLGGGVVVEVMCRVEDLLGVGTNVYGDKIYKQAVFSKVTLTKKEYQKHV